MPIHVFAGSLTRPMPQYGAANGKGIARLTLNDDTGQLVVNGITDGIDDSTWLVANAAGDRLYATCEVTGADQSAVAAYAIDPATGALSQLNTQPTLGGEVCHGALSRDGRHLLVANYNGATPAGWPDQSVSVFPLAADGSLEPAVCSVRHEGHGPNAERQTTAHAHCVIPSPDGCFVYVADLGTDRLVAYAFAADGRLTAAPARDFAVPPGLGPRHIVFRSRRAASVHGKRVDPNGHQFCAGPCQRSHVGRAVAADHAERRWHDAASRDRALAGQSAPAGVAAHQQ